VLKTARAGGEGGRDYIFADAFGRRLDIPRGTRRVVSATATAPETPAVQARLTIFDLDTLKPVGKIACIGSHPPPYDCVESRPVQGNSSSRWRTSLAGL